MIRRLGEMIMPVQMELARILIRDKDDPQVLELREVDGERIFPIVIGLQEASAIERRLLGDIPPRPQTHELLASVIEHLGGRLEQIQITDLQHDAMGNGTFFARLFIRQGDHVVDVDARPSDAIALGVAENVPIFVDEHVLEEVCKPL